MLAKDLVTRSMVTACSNASGFNSQQKAANLAKSWEKENVHTIVFFLIIPRYLFTNSKTL